MLICYFTQVLSKVTRANQWGSEGGAYTAEAAKTFVGNYTGMNFQWDMSQNIYAQSH